MIGAVGRSFLLLPTRSRLKRMTMPGIILLQTGQGTSNELRGEEQTIDRAQPVRPCSSACCSGPGCGWITKTIMTSTRVTYTSLSECVREVRAWTRIESVGLSVESTRVAFFFFFFFPPLHCIAFIHFIPLEIPFAFLHRLIAFAGLAAPFSTGPTRCSSHSRL